MLRRVFLKVCASVIGGVVLPPLPAPPLELERGLVMGEFISGFNWWGHDIIDMKAIPLPVVHSDFCYSPSIVDFTRGYLYDDSLLDDDSEEEDNFVDS